MELELKCKDRVESYFKSRYEDITKLYEAYCSGEEEVEDLGILNEYGLCFDYVAPNTFTDQEQGYFRYQLSWGGPSDEFRFYVNPDLSCYRVEYWFLDWGDGASITLSGDKKSFMKELFQSYFVDSGSAQYTLEKATEE